MELASTETKSANADCSEPMPIGFDSVDAVSTAM